MTRYRVTFGEAEAVVDAESPAEAWAKFCDGKSGETARKHPNLHERVVEPVDATPATETEADKPTKAASKRKPKPAE